jgi:hypothetical protein
MSLFGTRRLSGPLFYATPRSANVAQNLTCSPCELAARSLVTFSADVVADDWYRRITPAQIIKRAMSRLEKRGKGGILLLHDIHPATVAAVPRCVPCLRPFGDPSKVRRGSGSAPCRARRELRMAPLGDCEPRSAGDPCA